MVFSSKFLSFLRSKPKAANFYLHHSGNLCLGIFISHMSTESHSPTFDPSILLHPESDINRWTCAICLGILRRPQLTNNGDARMNREPCGHSFCQDCIIKHLEGHSQTCPTCRAPLAKSQLVFLANVEREIANAKVKCKHANDIKGNSEESHGCVWEGVFGKQGMTIAKHLTLECPFEILQCPYDRCSTRLPHPELSDHVGTCAYRSGICAFCSKALQLVDLPIHQTQECLLFPYDCPLGCTRPGTTEITQICRETSNQHFNKECPNTIQLCRFSVKLPGEKGRNDICRVSQRRKSIGAHELVCENQTVCCQYCSSEIRVQSTQIHEQICPKMPVSCQCDPLFSCPRQDLSTHIQASCPITKVPCRFKRNGCDLEVKRKDLPEHEKTQCQHTEYTCQHCATPFLIEKFRKEHTQVCPKSPIPCLDCKETYTADTKDGHRCPFKAYPCDFAALGCTELVQGKDMSTHNSERMAYHMSLLLKSHDKMAKTLKNLEDNDERDAQLQSRVCNICKGFALPQCDSNSIHHNVFCPEYCFIDGLNKNIINLPLFRTLDDISLNIISEYSLRHNEGFNKLNQIDRGGNRFALQIYHYPSKSIFWTLMESPLLNKYAYYIHSGRNMLGLQPDQADPLLVSSPPSPILEDSNSDQAWRQALAVNSRLLARDRCRKWYKSIVSKVRKQELLVHFEGFDMEFDEWIPRNSHDLKPFKLISIGIRAT